MNFDPHHATPTKRPSLPEIADDFFAFVNYMYQKMSSKESK